MPRPRAQVLTALLLTQLAAFVPKAQRRQTVKIKSESDGRLLAVKAREAEPARRSSSGSKGRRPAIGQTTIEDWHRGLRTVRPVFEYKIRVV